MTIVTFQQLNVWQKAHSLALFVYKSTESYPSKEKFSLTSQMRRSALSITSNIAEGFGRRNAREKQQFYFVAKGSATELQNQLILSKDLGLIAETNFLKVEEEIIGILKMLSKLISSIS